MKANIRLLLIFSTLLLAGIACSFIGDDTFITDMEFSPDGTLLAGSASNKTIRIWDANTGKLLKTLRANEMVDSVAFSPDGKMLASGAADLSVTVWNTSDWSKIHVIQHEMPNTGSLPAIPTVAFSPDGRYLIILSTKFEGEIRDTENWGLVKNLETDVQNYGAVSEDKRFFAVTLEDGNTVRVYDLTSFEIVFQTQIEEGNLGWFSFALSPDGKFLATGSKFYDDRWKYLYEIRDMSCGKVIKSWITLLNLGHLAYSPDGNILAIGDFEVTFWDTRTGLEIQTNLENFQNSKNSIAYSIHALDFSPDGTRIAVGTFSNEYGVWDVSTGEKIWGWVILNR